MGFASTKTNRQMCLTFLKSAPGMMFQLIRLFGSVTLLRKDGSQGTSPSTKMGLWFVGETG